MKQYAVYILEPEIAQISQYYNNLSAAKCQYTIEKKGCENYIKYINTCIYEDFINVDGILETAEDQKAFYQKSIAEDECLRVYGIIEYDTKTKKFFDITNNKEYDINVLAHSYQGYTATLDYVNPVPYLGE